MEIIKMPRMDRSEYDRLIEEEHICRIAFKGESHPYIAPFLYVFDGQHMYFLSTRYGKKQEYFSKDPYVSVEVERYAKDLSQFSFVTLPGSLAQVEDASEKLRVRQMFVDLIKGRNISQNILSALGHLPGEPVEALLDEGKTSVWKLVRVKEIIGLKALSGHDS